ncbi:unnamed protein product [Paramecium octaurelia]|uniref:Uncharacterized protein n=1 Tax=Paramecium octaurelia TaxID=43137 RepID=A0A8S1V0D7_PAROT|nr:unnamed protein product [Paramecium octaurelia]
MTLPNVDYLLVLIFKMEQHTSFVPLTCKLVFHKNYSFIYYPQNNSLKFIDIEDDQQASNYCRQQTIIKTYSCKIFSCTLPKVVL